VLAGVVVRVKADKRDVGGSRGCRAQVRELVKGTEACYAASRDGCLVRQKSGLWVALEDLQLQCCRLAALTQIGSGLLR